MTSAANFVRNRTNLPLFNGDMDNPGTLRRKAAHLLEGAAASATPTEAAKLNEVGRQLELWADDLEEMPTVPRARRRPPRLRNTRQEDSG